jgi:hypothetical protein
MGADHQLYLGLNQTLKMAATASSLSQHPTDFFSPATSHENSSRLGRDGPRFDCFKQAELYELPKISMPELGISPSIITKLPSIPRELLASVGAPSLIVRLPPMQEFVQ